MNGLAKLIGCRPSKWLLLREPKLIAKYYFCSHVSYQYRLSGPGKQTAMAKDVITHLPIGWSRREIFRYSVQSVLSVVDRWFERFGLTRANAS